jgi:hypothetical protein
LISPAVAEAPGAVGTAGKSTAAKAPKKVIKKNSVRPAPAPPVVPVRKRGGRLAETGEAFGGGKAKRGDQVGPTKP